MLFRTHGLCYFLRVLTTRARITATSSALACQIRCQKAKLILTMASVSSDASDDFEWQPPNEAEMKIIQAKRERADKISQIMGEYLLKGYKMLGSTCNECGCILLQDKQKKNYCISCSELDSDTGKDDPACNQEAARRVVEEGRQRGVGVRSGSPDPQAVSSAPGVFNSNSTSPSDEGIDTGMTNNNNPPRLVNRPQLSPPARPVAPAPASRYRMPPSGSGATVIIRPETSHRQFDASVPGVSENDILYSQKTVRTKLIQATRDLEQSMSIENSIRACELIRACADTLASLYTLQGCLAQQNTT